MSSLRRCVTCSLEKPREDFYRVKRGNDGLHGSCKRCVNDDATRRRRANPERYEEIKAYRRAWGSNPDNARRTRARKYGMSLQEFDEKVEDQAHRCAICNQELPLVMDHDHDCCATQSSSCGKCNRDLLCASCNSGLGYFKDDPDRLRVAAEYLLKWKATIYA